MLDTNIIKMGSTTSNVTLNTPSHGMIQRSHPKSKLIKFKNNEYIEDAIFPSNGRSAYINLDGIYNTRVSNYHYDRNVNIQVLQVMVFGDISYLIEYVEDSDLIENEAKG